MFWESSNTLHPELNIIKANVLTLRLGKRKHNRKELKKSMIIRLAEFEPWSRSDYKKLHSICVLIAR
jgi:hypothetical protein